MAIQASCPHCEATFKLPDTAAGKKFRCKECEEIFAVGKNGKNGKPSAETRIQSKSSGRKPSAAADEEEEDEDEEEEKETKKKKKKKKGKKGGASMMPIILAAGGGVVLLAAGVVVFFIMNSGPTNVPAPPPKDNKVVENPVPKPPQQQVPANLPALDAKDPVLQKLAYLKLDPINRQAEVLAAVDWFNDPTKSDTFHPKDKDKKIDHPKRDEVAKLLELLIDHPAYELRDECWSSWTRWVTKEHLEAVKLHLHRAPKSEYRVFIMNSLARFNTEESIELLAVCISAPERATAVKLLEGLAAPYMKAIKPGVVYKSIKDLPPNPVARKVEPYIYHAEEEIRDLTFSLLKKFMIERDWLPRVPLLEEEIDLDAIVPILSAAEAEFEGPFWFRSSLAVHDEVRLKKLAAMGWLQKQPLSGAHWKAISGVLDPLASSSDQFKRYNAILCLERWATSANLGTLAAGVTNKTFKKESHLMVEIITKIPDPAAGSLLVPMIPDLIPDLEPRLITKLGEYMKSLSAPEAMKTTLRFFNHKDPKMQAMARAAVAIFRARSGTILTNDDVVEQCMADLGSEDTRTAAISWLTTSSPPDDRKFREDTMKSLAMMAKDPEHPLRGGASATLSRWASVAVPKTP